MPLITCVECGQGAVSAAGICPKCGNSPVGRPCRKCALPTSVANSLCISCQDKENKEKERLLAFEKSELSKWLVNHKCSVCGNDLKRDSGKCKTTYHLAIGVQKKFVKGKRDWVDYSYVSEEDEGGGQFLVAHSVQCSSCGQGHDFYTCPVCHQTQDGHFATQLVKGSVHQSEGSYDMYLGRARSCPTCADKAISKLKSVVPTGGCCFAIVACASLLSCLTAFSILLVQTF